MGFLEGCYNCRFGLITVRTPAFSRFERASDEVSEPVLVLGISGVGAEFQEILVELFRICDDGLVYIFVLLHLFNIKSSQIII